MILILFYEYSSCITIAPVAIGIRKSKPRCLSAKRSRKWGGLHRVWTI